jgi:hypothetical protein
MRVGYRRGVALAALALALAAGKDPAARTVLAAAARPAILGVRSDLVHDTITITGRGFGDAPEVALGGTPLVVTSAADTSIVAELPAGVSGMNHLLEVATGNRSDQTTIWIPGEGILTRGPIVVESTESSVRIQAGASRVIVDPAGGVRVESAGPLTVDAGGALTLRGSSVRIDSATSLRMTSGSTMDLTAGSSATLHSTAGLTVSSSGAATVSSAATMTINGALVRIN